MKDKHKTQVIFRKRNDDVIALFPYLIGGYTYIMSYEHVSRHSDADYGGIIQVSRKATRSEFQPLFEELESIGYNLEICIVYDGTLQLDHLTMLRSLMQKVILE